MRDGFPEAQGDPSDSLPREILQDTLSLKVGQRLHRAPMREREAGYPNLKKSQHRENTMKSRAQFLLWTVVFFFSAAYAQEATPSYREKFSDSFSIRKKNHLDVNKYLDALLEEQINRTLTRFQPDYASLERYTSSVSLFRGAFLESIGYPPLYGRAGEIRMKQVGEDSFCRIYRIWVEVLPGIDAYGVYLVPRNLLGKAPMIMAIHGGGGCPEAIIGIDNREPYHNMGYEAVKRGYIVWAPELLDRVTYGGDPLIPEAYVNKLDRKARLVGTTLNAILLHRIIAGTDALIKARPEIDTNRIGVTGLSRGGGFTLLTTAALPYIKCAVCSGMFTDHADYLKMDRTDPEKPADNNVLKEFGHAELVGMICPRPLMVQMGIKDDVIPIEGARKERMRAALPYQKLGIPDRFEFLEHAGGHEFHLDSLFAFFLKNL